MVLFFLIFLSIGKYNSPSHPLIMGKNMSYGPKAISKMKLKTNTPPPPHPQKKKTQNFTYKKKLRFKDGIVLETTKYYCNNLLKILKNIYLNNIKKVNRARELSIQFVVSDLIDKLSEKASKQPNEPPLTVTNTIPHTFRTVLHVQEKCAVHRSLALSL